MRVLVTWGSKLGGTEGIARKIGQSLTLAGIEVVELPAGQVSSIAGYDGVIVGGSVYAGRWHRDARRLVTRNLAALRQVPVWLFSSGPLDTSADGGALPPVAEVDVLMERLGAMGHRTFGGRLAPDATGFPAAAMAKKHSGDWRNHDVILAWAEAIVADLPTARPNVPHEPVGGSIGRLAGFGVAGWAICGVISAGLLQVASAGTAAAIHSIAAPLVFIALSVAYFSARGAWQPLPTAAAFTAIVALLDAAVVAPFLMGSFAMFASVPGSWLPFALIFVATAATGFVMTMRAALAARAAPPAATP